MIILDSTFMIAFLHPNPETPMDNDEKPVERFKDRINALISSINASGEKIGIPSPVVAEILILYPDNKYEYLEVLRDRYRFEIIPFGVKAAIEASDLIAILAAESKQSAAQWRKVKFDIQIAAIAKAESATVIYADDKGIINNAKRLKITGKRICDLPLAPEPEPLPVLAESETGTIGNQATLFEMKQPLLKAMEAKPEQDADEVIENEHSENIAEEYETEGTKDGEQRGTALPDPAPVRGSDERRVESQASGEGASKAKAHQEGGLGEGGL
jgi:predicted nucleic acid-binding protein